MNYYKTKHSILGLLLDVHLNYMDEYHVINESFLTIDQVVKKTNLKYDIVKVILSSLSANEEIKFHNSLNEFDLSGYRITNNGVFAYEDEKYLRIKIERSRATWSFYLSIASFIGSIIAIVIAIQ